MVVSGCFYPAVSQALLLSGAAAFAIVHVVSDSAHRSAAAVVEALLREQAARWNVAALLCAVRVVRVAAGANEAAVAAAVGDACRQCCSVDGANAIVLSGTHCSAGPLDVPVVDATLAGLYAVEALVRSRLQQSRRVFPLVVCRETE